MASFLRHVLRVVPYGPLDLVRLAVDGAGIDPAPTLTVIEDRGSRSRRADQPNFAIRVGEVFDGQVDDRSVSNVGRSAKGWTTSNDLAGPRYTPYRQLPVPAGL
jgi:hypothetical protein